MDGDERVFGGHWLQTCKKSCLYSWKLNKGRHNGIMRWSWVCSYVVEIREWDPSQCMASVLRLLSFGILRRGNRQPDRPFLQSTRGQHFVSTKNTLHVAWVGHRQSSASVIGRKENTEAHDITGLSFHNPRIQLTVGRCVVFPGRQGDKVRALVAEHQMLGIALQEERGICAWGPNKFALSTCLCIFLCKA